MSRLYFPPEAKFVDVMETKVLRFFLFVIHSHLYKRILLPPTCEKVVLKLVCNVNIVYGNLKSENNQDFAQKPQRNCKLMNPAPVVKLPWGGGGGGGEAQNVNVTYPTLQQQQTDIL
jgi:hypothetical protein